MAKTPARGSHAKQHHDDHDEGHGDDHGDGHGGGHCPPPWIITFADMATLLMAFFVLMLMTSKPDEPKFNAFAATMRQTFGTMIEAPNGVLEGGATMMNQDVGPQSGEPTEGEPTNSPETGGKATGEGQESGGADRGQGNDVDGIQVAIKEAVEEGGFKVEQAANTITIRLPEGAGAEKATAMAKALAKAGGTTVDPGTGEGAGAASAGQGAGAGSSVEGPGGTAEGMGDGPGTDGKGQGEGAGGTSKGQGGDAQQGNGTRGGDPQGGGAEGSGTGDGAEGTGTGGATPVQKAGIADAKLQVALSEEIGKGLIDVEMREGRVFVTVGAGGAFGSGSADLTEDAKRIMEGVKLATRNGSGKITVTGHTDDVPLSGSTYGDNWGLGAARASSVVRALIEEGIAPAQITAVSKGDTMPIADNTTEEGRAKNRRIEIEIDFEED